MPAEPLTPAEAVAIAAVLEAHPTREHMCASTGEKASHSGDSSARTGTMRGETKRSPRRLRTGGTSRLNLDRRNREASAA